MTDISSTALAKAESWLKSTAVDEASKKQIQQLMESDVKTLTESFYGDLEFGTGGLRGIMGVGTMCMNKYTVGMATQGFANYIISQFSGKKCSVAIAYDSRNNSKFFAETAATVLSANGISVHIFDELRPTPLLSFAVRQLKCQAGIVITASHNPKEYNGYKAYWEDGGQVLAPHDKGIISEVRKVTSPDDVKFDGDASLIHSIGPEIEVEYFKNLMTIIHSKKEIEQSSTLKVVYTSIHGAGITMVPKALSRLGFQNVYTVEEQAIPDGNFSTVVSPNPEEKEALSMALALAEKQNADVVLGTDPDTDRVGLAIRNNEGNMVLMNGNQTLSLIVYYQLTQWKNKNLLTGKEYIAKTTVTTNLVEKIAEHFNVKWYETLTGFKNIAGVIGKKEGAETFICGGEESYGYSVGEFVRDKDAIISSAVICEIAAWCNANNRTMWDLLMEIFEQLGLYHETLLSVTIKGLEGIQKINEKMVELRSNPPSSLGGSAVVALRDIQIGELKDLVTGKSTKVDLPVSNVLQFMLADGSKITARPSGTEPKIKFYFSLKEKFEGPSQYGAQVLKMEARIKTIQGELGL